MASVTVRHFAAEDIPLRLELLREARFQANLSDFAVQAADADLVADVHRTIAERQAERRIFTLCTAGGRVMGFAWITSVDWRHQSCELSFGMLPRYRGGLGALAVEAAHDYVRAELNMRVVVNQVLEHNTMLQSAASLAANRQVRCAYDSYTVGEWRATCYWTLTEEDVAADRALRADRRRRVAERIRARTGDAG
ncbi:GNAT family N-acetyltransferase [Streptomyces sp. DSM 44915]|uniref:GNAT family N-acetyltransferase n=1 Tax=Streptomyces chisholmiae TaxID=3075540 RepID=A0ABU2JQU8_9ACTN|nr:GNAT family N-acetyltransferase [Streptomyces sp. DSM 44915]MDT0267361.1 GNAT family N-acetyltransferase [Streptomyces sp. DSM 44915]